MHHPVLPTQKVSPCLPPRGLHDAAVGAVRHVRVRHRRGRALLTLGATVWLLLAIFAVVFVAYVLLRIAYLKRQGRDLMAELKAPYAPFEEREAECAAMDAGK